MSLLDIINKKIADAQAAIAEREAKLDSIIAAAESEARDLTADEATEFRSVKAEIKGFQGDVAELRDRARDIEDQEARKAAAAAAVPFTVPAFANGTHTEERTYRPDRREQSFFSDAFKWHERSDRNASERIERHMRESEVEFRDITTGTLNGLVPPLYLLDQAARLARAGRVLADAYPKYPLPEFGMTMYATRVTTSPATAMQTSQNTAPMETDIVTTDLSFGVNSLIGVQDISRQALQRGAVTDQLIMNELVADYAQKLDTQLISGSGSNGQHKGLLNIGATTASFTGTTVASFYSKVVGLLSGVASNRYQPAEVIIMAPRRWHWLLAQSDTSGRPVVVPNPGASFNVMGTGGTAVDIVAGTLAGVPVIVDANMSLTEGASSNEDRVIVTRLSDAVFAEGDLMSFQFEQFITPPTTIRLAVMGYSAFTAERYTVATQVLVGTGLTAPTF